MLSNKSEEEITLINQNVFFKEFTFDKNDFMIDNQSKVELADNILWLDDLLIIIQIKEKNLKGSSSVDTWLRNKVLNKAKNQIKKTHEYLLANTSIPIANRRNQKHILNIRGIKVVHNLIIYKAECSHDISSAPSKYITKEDRFIHFLRLEDYGHICRYLITPVELSEYLFFREEFLRKNNVAGNLPEQYMLAHFFQNPTDLTLNFLYLQKLSGICKRILQTENDFYIGYFLSMMKDTLYGDNGSSDYLHIIRELARMNREEMKIFKERFRVVITEDPKSLPVLMKRFALERTDCGFVLMKLNRKFETDWYNALTNFTIEYKYRRKLGKCVGLIILPDGEYFNLKWCYIQGTWQYDAFLEEMVKEDIEINGKGKRLEYLRYKDLIN